MSKAEVASLTERQFALNTSSTKAAQSSEGLPVQDPEENHPPTIATKLKRIVAEPCEISPSDIADDAQLAEIGIDSLMAMELCKEIEAFNISIPEGEWGDIVDFLGLAACVRRHTDSESDAKDAQTPSSSDNASKTLSINSSSTGVSLPNELKISSQSWIRAFEHINADLDTSIQNCGFSDYLKEANIQQTKLCVLLIVEALGELGIDGRQAQAGAAMQKPEHASQHTRLINFLYNVWEKHGDFLRQNGDSYMRTDIEGPTTSAKAFADKLLSDHPLHANATQLTYYVGSHLAEVLRGKETGVKLIFGSQEGRDLVSEFYGQWLLNLMLYQQMAALLSMIAEDVPQHGFPSKILEIGAGTCGISKVLLPVLASLGIAVEYTVRDLSPAFVAQARKHLKECSLVKFRAHDIEKPPPEDLYASQHVVLASNAIHATHNLAGSTAHMKEFLSQVVSY